MVTPSKAQEEEALHSKHITVGEDEGERNRGRERGREKKRRRRKRRRFAVFLRSEEPSSKASDEMREMRERLRRKKKLTSPLLTSSSSSHFLRPLGPVQQRPHYAHGQGHPSPQDGGRDSPPPEGESPPPFFLRFFLSSPSLLFFCLLLPQNLLTLSPLSLSTAPGRLRLRA